jgi:hypothetical protein
MNKSFALFCFKLVETASETHECSPDLVPCDFFLFPRMKLQPKGRRFQDVFEILEQLLTIPQCYFKMSAPWCFQQWQKCWACCINSEGDYYEAGDNDQ